MGGALAAAGLGARRRVTDAAVRDSLAARVIETAPELQGAAATPLVRNVYSFVFALQSPGGRHPGVFIKIPKQDLRRQPPHVLPLTAADVALGRGEYDSLCYLNEAWRPGDDRVHFVKPLTYFADFNAIVTLRADGVEALDAFRRAAISERALGTRGASDRLRRIAGALRRFHARSTRPGHLDVAALRHKVRGYAGRLRAWGVSTRLLERFDAEFDRRCPSADVPVALTTTLKGIDIRNVLIAADDTLHLLDPGVIKQAPAEADLARFLMTWRILFWGSAGFALGATPPARAEAAFLEAYGPLEPLALRLMLIKEVLKHWFTAHDSLRLKGFGPARTRLVGRLYIDPFYRRQLRNELAKLQP